MRLIMMGTGPFAVPTFRGLFSTEADVVALVTSPLRTHRGKRVAQVSEMRDIAHEHGTEILDPENINTPESQAMLRRYDADLHVVCDYGQILSSETLATARFGGINLHGSLLPKYRGAAPVNWAMYHGEKKTGVTVIHMTPRVDAGPCIAQAETEILPDETAGELEERLAELGQWLIIRAIGNVESGNLESLPQDPALASRAPRLKKSDGLIDWSRPACAIRDHIRALDPWPKTFTYWHRTDGAPVRLILGPCDVLTVEDLAEWIEQVDCQYRRLPPGTVIGATDDRLVITTGESFLVPRMIQPAGKRLMPIDEFLRGNRVTLGDRFGPERLPN